MRLGVWLAFLLGIASCCCYADANDLTKTWYLTSLNSVPIELISFPERKPYLKLSVDQRYTAYAGCNEISGTYALEEHHIHFSPPAVTRMACAHNMEFEQEFLQMLAKVEFWGVIGGQILNLTSQELAIIAVFTAAEMN